jgi:hypothetical protein
VRASTPIALECGYPASSLRERIYLCPTQNKFRGGMLIYTGSSDAEGTLGGLVQTGRDIKTDEIVAAIVHDHTHGAGVWTLHK